MRALVLMAVALWTPTDAVGAKRPPRMTGDQLIAELRGGPNAERYFNKHYAEGYLTGVVDATQGHGWCFPIGLKPETGDDQVLHELAQRPVGSMPGSASAILVQQYRTRFPSPDGKCSFEARLTSNDFIVWIVGNHQKPAADRVNPSLEVIQREQFANGYVGGVVDATQGTTWCAPARIKPHELEAVGYWGLLEKQDASIPHNAATLLHAQFRAKFPCRPRK